MLNLNFNDLMEINQVLQRLHNLPRWSIIADEDQKYDELSKQGLNCIIAYFIIAYCEHEGKSVKLENFFKISMFRSFKKCELADIHKKVIDEFCDSSSGAVKELFEEVIPYYHIQKKTTNPDFASYLFDGLGTLEDDIYNAATKIATYIELLEKMEKNTVSVLKSEMQQVFNSINYYKNIPGVAEISDIDGDIFKLLQSLAKRLRNQRRWKLQDAPKRCGLLGHLFDAGIFNYLITIEKYPASEKLAGKNFFVGIFHDLPEAWTGDWPSPLKKENIGELIGTVKEMYGCVPEKFNFLFEWENDDKNIRSYVLKYEKKILEQKLYSKLPDFVSDKLKEVLEDEEYEAINKGADLLSAAREICKEAHFGSQDSYYVNTPLPNTERALDDGKADMGILCRKLFDYYKREVEGKIK